MTGHDPDDGGDDSHDPGDDPRDARDAPHAAGDDADGTPPAGEGRPDDWPEDWTAADDDAHAPTSEDSPNDGDPDDEGVDHDRPTDDDPTGERAGPSTANPSEPGDATVDEEGSTTARAAAAGASAETTDSTLGDRSTAEKPPAPNVDESGPTIADDGLLTWFMNTNNGLVVVVRDVVSSVAAVAAIGLVLFAISGIWPPLVAVESGSMEPHMSKGDLVFLVDEDRFVPQSGVGETGVSTYRSASDANGYSKFGSYGDVVVYRPNGQTRSTPIIHRARFHVEEGENWVADADPAHLGSVDSCNDLSDTICPAPHDGFITKGDANPTYDQVGGQSTVVKDEWIRGKAEVRIPFLGWIRLEFAKLATAGTTQPGLLGGIGGIGGIGARLGALGLAGTAAVVSTRI